jgi:hypothetical protein
MKHMTSTCHQDHICAYNQAVSQGSKADFVISLPVLILQYHFPASFSQIQIITNKDEGDVVATRHPPSLSQKHLASANRCLHIFSEPNLTDSGPLLLSLLSSETVFSH